MQVISTPIEFDLDKRARLYCYVAGGCAITKVDAGCGA
jgi:hypothetical protein